VKATNVINANKTQKLR